jgi:hypothetical protein
MSKLSVVTPTCRANPRFAEMARTLFASFRRAPVDTLLEWIIVDDRLWHEATEDRQAPILEALAELPLEVQQRIHLDHFAPPATDCRGPDIADPLPAHNTARNAGLGAVALDSSYVVILSDCCAVTQDWVSVALECAAKNLGWRARIVAKHDHPIPVGAPFTFSESYDRMHAQPAQSAAGPCWGAPRDALISVGGFDTDFDGEDDYYDHEILLRLARVGVTFVSTRRATVVRLGRTKIKTDVTTRQGAIRASRNQAYYQQLGVDKARILPGAAAAAGIGSLAGRSAAQQAARPAAPAPAPRMASNPAMVQTARAAAPSAHRAPPRPAPTMPAAARAHDERVARVALIQPPAAKHANEICGHAHGESTCRLVTGHVGPHIHGTPEWVFGVDPSRYPELYQEQVAARQQATDPDLQAEIDTTLDDLWYVLSDEQRDEIDPDGAEQRALDRAPPPPPPAAPSLHERAKAAEQARKDRAAAERAGVAPPPVGDDRCSYVPNQGTFKGVQCRARARHGGAHSYEPQVAAAPAPAPPPKVQRPSREPPQPSEQVARTRAKLDEHAELIAQHLGRLPNDAARNVVMLAVIVRRDGILVDEDGFVEMLSEAIPYVGAAPDQSQQEALDAVRQVRFEQALISVRQICATLPKIPGTEQDFAAVASYAQELDIWRYANNIQPRAELSLYNRAYAAAGDLGIEVAAPDDFADYATDDLKLLERQVGHQPTTDDVASVEPLSEEEARAQAEAAQRLFDAEAAAAAQGQAAP